MDSSETLLLVWMAFLLACSAVAWIGSKEIQRKISPPPELNIRWLDYLIFLWIFIMVFMVMQTTLQIAIAPPEGTEGSEEVAGLTSSKEWSMVLGSLSLQIPMLAVMLLALGNRKVPFHHADVNTEKHHVLKELWIGFRAFLIFLPIIWIVANIWKFAIDKIYGLFSDEELGLQPIVTTVSETSDWAPLIVLTAIGVIMAPIAEEFFFRGSIYRYAKGIIGPRQAMVISSIIFACLHFNVRALMPLFIVGLLLAWIYERRGNIWAPIAFHAAFNAQSFLMIFILRSDA